MLELVALGSDPAAGLELARNLGGIAYVADGTDTRTMPWRSLVRVVTSDIDALAPGADIGRYLIYSRHMRANPGVWSHGTPTPGVVAAFGMIHHPDLSHNESDAHWRDKHAPLALRHHIGMWDYTQCSVVQTLQGPAYDGFAFHPIRASVHLRRSRTFASGSLTGRRASRRSKPMLRPLPIRHAHPAGCSAPNGTSAADLNRVIAR